MPGVKQLLAGCADEAVARAIHDSDPARFHAERVVKQRCPFCPNLQQRLQAAALDHFPAHVREQMIENIKAIIAVELDDDEAELDDSE